MQSNARGNRSNTRVQPIRRAKPVSRYQYSGEPMSAGEKLAEVGVWVFILVVLIAAMWVAHW